MTPEVTAFIDKIALPWQADLCSRIRAAVHQAAPDVTERIQYGKPHFLKGKKYLAVLGTAKGWVTFTIFNAEALQPPAGVFESSETGDRKTIKIVAGQALDTDLLLQLIQQAAATL
jgi:hypothetical protein